MSTIMIEHFIQMCYFIINSHDISKYISITHSIYMTNLIFSLLNNSSPDLVLNYFDYLSPKELSTILPINKYLHNNIIQHTSLKYQEFFGKNSHKNIRVYSLLTVLNNIILGESNIKIAKKLLCWSSSKNYIKFIDLIRQKKNIKMFKWYN